MQRIYTLTGKVQHYSWGGVHFIPELLAISNSEQKPFAEYWMGAHPNHPSTILINGNQQPLDQFIAEHKEDVLAPVIAKQFGSLPFLFKLLDVHQMLSIQVHPSKAEAEKNFARENEAGIALTAAHRNYKDDNHKPELMVALGDFWLLHGFKEPKNLEAILTGTPELIFLQPVFNEQGYAGLFSHVMNLEQQEVNERLELLAQRILPLYHNNQPEKSTEDFWAAKAMENFCKPPVYDRGIFCIYLFNLLQLKKGEGIYQPAGLPHAYLEGQNAEIMANSDNVLRAGLTDKHIDVSELLKHTICGPTTPAIIKPGNTVVTEYKSPAKEFNLYSYQTLKDELVLITNSAEIILVMEGELNLVCDQEALRLRSGQAAFLTAGSTVNIESAEGSRFFRATVGALQNTRL